MIQLPGSTGSASSRVSSPFQGSCSSAVASQEPSPEAPPGLAALTHRGQTRPEYTGKNVPPWFPDGRRTGLPLRFPILPPLPQPVRCVRVNNQWDHARR